VLFDLKCWITCRCHRPVPTTGMEKWSWRANRNKIGRRWSWGRGIFEGTMSVAFQVPVAVWPSALLNQSAF